MLKETYSNIFLSALWIKIKSLSATDQRLTISEPINI